MKKQLIYIYISTICIIVITADILQNFCYNNENVENNYDNRGKKFTTKMFNAAINRVSKSDDNVMKLVSNE